jgi:hypothetical protein
MLGDEDDLEFEDDGMLLDPPDPVDLLIAHTEEATHQPRAMDFVRIKVQGLKQENKKLKERVADLEQTLSIVQTAQEWTVGKGMTAEQQEKMKEIKSFLEQAKRAREELQNFSGVTKQSLYEKLRQCKNMLKREREEKREMRERLAHAFHHARTIQDDHRRMSQARDQERIGWQDRVRDVKERHHRELLRLQGDQAAQASDRQDQLSQFGEQVMSELSALHQHLKEVKAETVDTVLAEDGNEDIDYDLPPPESPAR